MGFFFSLAAIIMGIVALVKINKNQDALKGKGLAISGIVLGSIGILVIPIIAMLAAIAVPNFLRARMAANEAMAQSSIQAIAQASQTYREVNQAFPQTSIELTGANPPFLAESVLQNTEDHGYFINIINTYDDQRFFAKANPVQSGASGTRSFCVVGDGVVRVDMEGNDIYTHDSCQKLPAVQSNPTAY